MFSVEKCDASIAHNNCAEEDEIKEFVESLLVITSIVSDEAQLHDHSQNITQSFSTMIDM